MKQYPSIDHNYTLGHKVYLFDKLDGSNLRAEWSLKHKKFTKFGSRTVLLDTSHEILGPGVELITQHFQELFNQVFIPLRTLKVIGFFEFFGPNSFAGRHSPEDIKQVKLIDLNLHPQGIIIPKKFLQLTPLMPTAQLLYQGPLTAEIVDQIKQGTLPGMTFEGVIGKMDSGTPGLPKMFKIKNEAWINKLKIYCNGDLQLFQQLL